MLVSKKVIKAIILLFMSFSVLALNLEGATGKKKKNKKSKNSQVMTEFEDGESEPNFSPEDDQVPKQQVESRRLFGLQVGTGIDIVKLKDNSGSSMGGLSLDLNGVINLGLGSRFKLPLSLGLGAISWSGESDSGELKVSFSAQTFNLGIGGYFAITPKFHLGLLAEHRYGLGGSVKAELTILGNTYTSTSKLDNFSYTLFGPGLIYAFNSRHRIVGDLRFGSGTFKIKSEGSQSVKLSITTLRVSYGFMF